MLLTNSTRHPCRVFLSRPQSYGIGIGRGRCKMRNAVESAVAVMHMISWALQLLPAVNPMNQRVIRRSPPDALTASMVSFHFDVLCQYKVCFSLPTQAVMSTTVSSRSTHAEYTTNASPEEYRSGRHKDACTSTDGARWCFLRIYEYRLASGTTSWKKRLGSKFDKQKTRVGGLTRTRLRSRVFCATLTRLHDASPAPAPWTTSTHRHGPHAATHTPPRAFRRP